MVDWAAILAALWGKHLRVGFSHIEDSYGRQLRHGDTFHQEEGSFGSSARWCKVPVPESWQSEGMPETVLRFSGNPVKAVQMGNVHGPPVAYLDMVMSDVVARFRVNHPELSLPDYDPGFPLRRVCTHLDINVSVRMSGGQAGVNEFLAYALHSSRTRSGEASDVAPRGLSKNMVGVRTVYWNRGSRLWRFKAYGKQEEVKVHPVPDRVCQRYLEEASEGLLRLELTLLTKRLEVEKVLSEDLVWKYSSENITFGSSNDGSNEGSIGGNDMEGYEGLRPIEKMTLMAWMAKGVIVKEQMTKSTFYRVRAGILDKTDYDISVEPFDQIVRRPAHHIPTIAELRGHEVKDSDFPELAPGGKYGWNPLDPGLLGKVGLAPREQLPLPDPAQAKLLPDLV